MSDNNCVFCSKDTSGGCCLVWHKWTVCVDCRREIAKAYAQGHLDPVEVIILKHKGYKVTHVDLKEARRVIHHPV